MRIPIVIAMIVAPANRRDSVIALFAIGYLAVNYHDYLTHRYESLDVEWRGDPLTGAFILWSWVP